ncbi:MAG TPA: DUF4328 domain-containing protein [Nocardioidaceae bacterium]|nr:DUF4328 domain-containing protein [Nocardioidaceae bacterium]
MEAPANWYPDPGNPSQLRYWDGASWTSHAATVWTPPVPADRTYYPAPVLARAAQLVVAAVAASFVASSLFAVVGAASDDRAGEIGYVSILVLTGVLQVLAYPICCLWLWQARENAEALRPEARHARSRGWVWGGWICPFVNLWFPYQIVRDIRAATKPSDRRTGVPAYWWTVLLFCWVAGRVSLPLEYGTADLASWEVVAAGAGILAAVMWVLIVRQVTRDQTAAAAQRP